MTHQPASASGEQYEITLGTHRAEITEVGAGLRSYTVDGRDVIDGYHRDEMCPSGRGQILAPWPNRLEDGAYDFGGQRHQVPLNEPDAHNAIHGLVRWDAWTVRDRQPEHIALEHRLHPRPGYPFSLVLTVEYTLSDDGLAVRTTALNGGRDACPYGSGAASVSHPRRNRRHPDAPSARGEGVAQRFARPSERRCQCGRNSLRLPSAATHRRHHPGPLLHRPRPRCGRCRAWVELREQDGDEGITLWVDRSYPYLMLFTGDPLPDVARRALAVEPMTCPPNAFRTNTAVISLAPGEATSARWGITHQAVSRRS